MDLVPTLFGRRGRVHVLLAIGFGFLSAVLLSAVALLIAESLPVGGAPPWLGTVVAGGGWALSTLALLQPRTVRGLAARACSIGIAEWAGFTVALEAADVVALVSVHKFAPRALALSVAFCVVGAAGPVVLLRWLRRRLDPAAPTGSPARLTVNDGFPHPH
jgi:hypothetical protein